MKRTLLLNFDPRLPWCRCGDRLLVTDRELHLKLCRSCIPAVLTPEQREILRQRLNDPAELDREERLEMAERLNTAGGSPEFRRPFWVRLLDCIFGPEEGGDPL